MRKILLTLVAAVLSLTASAQDAATEAAGTYKGSISVTLLGESVSLDNQQVVMTASANGGAVDFTLYNFSFPMGGSTLPLGDIALSNIPVSLTDGTITFGANDPVSLTLGEAPVVIKATAKINEGESRITNGEASIRIDVVWTDQSLPIDVVFTGVKDNTVGITTVTTTTPAATGVYTLSGVRLNTTGSTEGLPTGIYIINGKKTIIK